MSHQNLIRENPSLARTLQSQPARHLPLTDRGALLFGFNVLCESLRHVTIERPLGSSDIIDSVEVIGRLKPGGDPMTALAIDIACLRLRTRMALNKIRGESQQYWRLTWTDVEPEIGRRLDLFFPWLRHPDAELSDFATRAMDELEALNELIIDEVYRERDEERRDD